VCPIYGKDPQSLRRVTHELSKNLVMSDFVDLEPHLTNLEVPQCCIALHLCALDQWRIRRSTNSLLASKLSYQHVQSTWQQVPLSPIWV